MAKPNPVKLTILALLAKFSPGILLKLMFDHYVEMLAKKQLKRKSK